jgi:hypothetical protein
LVNGTAFDVLPKQPASLIGCITGKQFDEKFLILTTIGNISAHQKSMLERIETKDIRGENGTIVASYARPFFWAPFIIVGDNGMTSLN